mmetsp:Transcript_37419/g.38099  ORF Transcript_37419/g.38099 Transcript_37419/m.38099 type:complete len:469 (-) Transcript_37419:117-1523(-)
MSSGGDGNKPSGPQVGPYIFGKTLGTGATGKVKLAKHVESGELVAIKIIRKDFLARKPSLRKKLLREIAVMKLCDHPNVLKLYDVFEIETHLFLVIEYVDGCELFDYLVKRGVLPKEEALSFFQQIIAGLEYCHKRLICHRDLKPENLLLDRSLNVKICDFGMTNLNPPGQFLETSCGSPHYAAPEVVSGDMYNGLEADIWSTGVILYAMTTGRLPFDDDNIQRLLNKVQRGVYHIPGDMDPECKSLVRAMLNVDPAKRISIEGIKQHPWFLSGPNPCDSYKDMFVAPTDPILETNPDVIRSLVDLGWGDAESIKRDLSSEGESLEKVFYVQLAKHPMFQRKDAPAQTEEKQEPEKKKRSAWSNIYDKGASNAKGPTKDSKPPASAPDAPKSRTAEEAAALAMEKLNLMSATGRVNAATVKKSPSQLVRQTELMNSSVANHPDPKHGGDEKSWFQNFSTIFSGSSPVS